MSADRWEVLDIPQNTIVKDWYEQGVRVLVMRGPSHLCAYVGVPTDHPLAGFDYDAVPLECHGGLTFSHEGDGEFRPAGYWWYGWDYGHSGDMATYYFEIPGLGQPHGKCWTVDEVTDEAKDVAWAFKRLCALTERIYERGTRATHTSTGEVPS